MLDFDFIGIFLFFLNANIMNFQYFTWVALIHDVKHIKIVKNSYKLNLDQSHTKRYNTD